MRRLLAIETSSEFCSVAVAHDGALRQCHEHTPLRHAERVLPMVNGLLTGSGLRLDQLDAIAFGRGPGSFTSLRIGIGVVQGLAWGAGLPVVPVSSLAAIAQQAMAAGAVRVLVAMDARMGEVFHCSYVADAAGLPRPLRAEAVSAPGVVAAGQTGTFTGAGNGFVRYHELAGLASRLVDLRADIAPSAAALIPLAMDWLRENDPLPAAGAQPVYVRNQVAKKPPVG